MSTVDVEATPADGHPSLNELTLASLSKSAVSRRRRWSNNGWSIAMGLALLIALVPLAFVAITVVSKGVGMIRADWFTKDIPTNITSAKLASKFGAAPETVVYGMLPAIYGTLLITGLASLMAIPVGILGAVYLREYGGRSPMASVIRFFTDVMSGVPSVVMGIFIYTVWVLHSKAAGRSAFAGALALACLMLPIVVRSTEEMLRLVPGGLREASAALGTPKWKTTMRVVLPAALPGITSGCMLAIARAAGETAPLLFTIGSVSALHLSISGQNTTLATQIYSNITQPGGEPLAWGAALTLISIVVLFTVIARVVSARFSIRSDQ